MKLNYEPVVITNLVVAVLAVFGYTLAETDVHLLGQVVAFVVPVVAALVGRRFTRSKASLQDEATVDVHRPGA